LVPSRSDVFKLRNAETDLAAVQAEVHLTLRSDVLTAQSDHYIVFHSCLHVSHPASTMAHEAPGIAPTRLRQIALVTEDLDRARRLLVKGDPFA
jgi:hypothetical protein